MDSYIDTADILLLVLRCVFADIPVESFLSAVEAFPFVGGAERFDRKGEQGLFSFERRAMLPRRFFQRRKRLCRSVQGRQEPVPIPVREQPLLVAFDRLER